MDKKLTKSNYLTIGSMLFGLFFGAGNLIFPVLMGQMAGQNTWAATLGFLTTAVIMPFLGVVAIGLSRKSGLFELASKVHWFYGYFMTILLYLTIGPFFSLPRLSTVSFEVGIRPFVADGSITLGLAILSILFYAAALFFSLKPSNVITYVGKILNPLFLLFLGILIFTAFTNPMGSVQNASAVGEYSTQAFFTGFLEGYNTMDALASLAFGVVVINTIKNFGVEEPKAIAMDTLKSGVISMVLMALIYVALAYLGALSLGELSIAENGGVALAQISNYYFGTFGSVLLAVIVTLACLKTAIGLIIACAEIFVEMFLESLSYKTYAVIFSVITAVVANIGLNNIIQFSLPVLMFIYPLAIVLILLALLSPLFKDSSAVYLITTLAVLPISILDMLKALMTEFPVMGEAVPALESLMMWMNQYFPFFELGLGWILPGIAGFVISFIVSRVLQRNQFT